MIKMLLIITQAERGGAQHWAFDVVTHLKRDRFEIAVAAGDDGPLLKNLAKKNIAVTALKNLTRNINPIKDVLAIWEIYLLIRKERPAILQLCSTKAGFLGAMAGRLAGVPKIIYRIGGWSFNDPRSTWQNKMFLWLEKLSAPLKDKVIVNSQKDFNQALKLKICPRENLILLYNGIDPHATMTNHSSDKKIKNGPLIIGAIANFYPTKGLRYFIEAVAMLKTKNYQLKTIIIGDGQERPLLESLIKKYKLENSVFLVGQKENPWEYLEKEGVDIFVIPSVKEGVPYVLLEAMARNLPIVATSVGGIPEIIKDGKSGLIIPPQNPTALAEAIQKLAGSFELREKLAQRARERVNVFSLQKMMAEFKKILG